MGTHAKSSILFFLGFRLCPPIIEIDIHIYSLRAQVVAGQVEASKVDQSTNVRLRTKDWLFDKAFPWNSTSPNSAVSKTVPISACCLSHSRGRRKGFGEARPQLSIDRPAGLVSRKGN